MLTTWKQTLVDRQAERKILQRNLGTFKQELAELELELEHRKEAHRIVQVAAQLTQEALQEQLGSVVSMALTAVFNDPYEFVVEFVSKRNTTECNFWFDRNGERCSPLDDSGYGAADIASIALRISFREASDTRPLLLLDEPCKNISRGYRTLAAVMFREMCKKLGLQMIVVSHIPEFREGADKLFMVSMDHKGVSRLEV